MIKVAQRITTVVQGIEGNFTQSTFLKTRYLVKVLLDAEV